MGAEKTGKTFVKLELRSVRLINVAEAVGIVVPAGQAKSPKLHVIAA